MHRPAITALLLWLCHAPAAAAKGPIDGCLGSKIQDTYGEGWAIRGSGKADLEFATTRYYKVSMLKGRTYRVLTCAQEGVKDLDVILYDKEGQIVLRDETTDREPTLAFTPQDTAVYYVVLYMRDVEDRSARSEARWALIHNDT